MTYIEDKTNMISRIQRIIDALYRSQKALRDDDPVTAKSQLSQVYVLGVGKIMDDLNKCTQGECEHDYRFVLMDDGKSVYRRCGKCRREIES